MLREKLVIFALDPKLDWATLTLVLASAQKFLWLVVHFDKKFLILVWNRNCARKYCSGIWPFLEIHTLKYFVKSLFLELHSNLSSLYMKGSYLTSLLVFLTSFSPLCLLFWQQKTLLFCITSSKSQVELWFRAFKWKPKKWILSCVI